MDKIIRSDYFVDKILMNISMNIPWYVQVNIMNKNREKMPGPGGSPESGSKNLSEKIRENIAESELQGGVYLENIEIGAVLKVRTENSTYIIEKRNDGFYISGHPVYCPDSVKANIHGSTWGGSALKSEFIGREMHLEFTTPSNKTGEVITTSKIKEIIEVERKARVKNKIVFPHQLKTSTKGAKANPVFNWCGGGL